VKRQVVEEFYNIFGPELKAVTGDPRHIEDVLKRVDALVKPIEEVMNIHKLCLYFFVFCSFINNTVVCFRHLSFSVLLLFFVIVFYSPDLPGGVLQVIWFSGQRSRSQGHKAQKNIL